MQAQCNSEKQALQQQIDAKEADLRAITGERDALKTQAETLQTDLASRGDQQQQHAEAIANLTQQHQQQLDAKDQALAAREAELTTQINDKETQIQQLNVTIQQKQVEIDGHVANIGNNQQAAQAQIAQLTQQNTELQAENDALKQKIVSATGAIVEAANNLEALMNSEPNQQSQSDIQAVFYEIELSLQAISNSMQGNVNSSSSTSASTSTSASASTQRVSRLPGNTNILYDNTNFTLDNLILQLQAKSQQQPNNPTNKYAQAIQQIRNARDPSDIKEILTRLNIMTTRNGLIRGGKYTKKARKGGKTKKIYRKQKGGYVYKSNKRKPISSIRAPSSTKFSSRR